MAEAPNPDLAGRAGERDPVRDVAPLVAAAAIAWWTTVRPSGFVPGATLASKVAAIVAIVGAGLAAWAVVRGLRHPFAIVLGAFVLPSAIAWVVGPEGATALSDPIEVLVGAIAWTTVGVLLIRPSAVAIPRGAEGGGGPTIGASDDAARVAMRELDASLVREPPPKLTPRNPMPRLASLPLWLAAAMSFAVAFPIVRIASSTPDRAVLARIVGSAVAIALLSTAGDLVEVRYLARRSPPPRVRLSRSAAAIAIVVLLVFVWMVAFGPEK